MKKWLTVLILGLVLVLGACGGDDAEEAGDDEIDVAAAEELVKSNCASCHSGDFELVPGDYDLSLEEMEDIILNGVGEMPAIDVTDEEATLISKYLVD